VIVLWRSPRGRGCSPRPWGEVGEGDGLHRYGPCECATLRRAAFLRQVVQRTAARTTRRAFVRRVGCMEEYAPCATRIVEAIDVVKQVNRSSQVNTLGFCVVVTRTSEEFEL